MNELVAVNKQLPNTPKQLADFVVINEEKLNAVKAAIRAAKKTDDVNIEKLEEQRRELEVTVVLAQCKLGELTKTIEPNITGRPQKSSNIRTTFATKQTQLSELGITKQRASEYERMAAHPEAVRRVIDNAEHVTKTAILREIKEETKKPHVTNNSRDDEWYTPAQYIEAARSVMGEIDLDPASNDFANETVKASTYYTEETNGLEQEWTGRIWMNPPYSTDSVKNFVNKLVSSNFDEAIVLVNNATETTWFRSLVDKAAAIVFTSGRIRFVKRDGAHGTPLQGQAFIYFGNNAEKFLNVFREYGWGCCL